MEDTIRACHPPEGAGFAERTIAPPEEGESGRRLQPVGAIERGAG